MTERHDERAAAHDATDLDALPTGGQATATRRRFAAGVLGGLAAETGRAHV